MYPRIDILRISVILTNTDRIQIVISMFERKRYFVTDILRTCITLRLYFILYCQYYTQAGTCSHMNCKLSSYRVWSYWLRKISRDWWVMRVGGRTPRSPRLGGLALRIRALQFTTNISTTGILWRLESTEIRFQPVGKLTRTRNLCSKSGEREWRLQNRSPENWGNIYVSPKLKLKSWIHPWRPPLTGPHSSIWGASNSLAPALHVIENIKVCTLQQASYRNTGQFKYKGHCKHPTIKHISLLHAMHNADYKRRTRQLYVVCAWKVAVTVL